MNDSDSGERDGPIRGPNAETDVIEASHTQPEAFDALYRRYYPRVHAYLRARVGSAEAADLAQQVFLHALIAIQRYDPARGSFATWLFAIARNAATDFSRGRRAAVPIELTSADAQASPPEHEPEAALVRAEDLARVRALVQALDPAARELLALRFAARLSSGEIAALVGTSEAATKKRLTRLLRSLRDEYQRQDLEELLPDLLEDAADEPAMARLIAALEVVFASPSRSALALGQRHSAIH